jgi:hypothetical protein
MVEERSPPLTIQNNFQLYPQISRKNALLGNSIKRRAYREIKLTRNNNCKRFNPISKIQGLLRSFVGSVVMCTFRSFEGLLCLVVSYKTAFITGFIHAFARVSLVKKTANGERMVELRNSFEDIWKSACGKNVESETEKLRTPFIVKALMAKRIGSSGPEEVLVFLKNDGSERLKKCSRCYMDDWGYYFNHLGQQGQRIGMHCKAVDRVSS